MKPGHSGIIRVFYASKYSLYGLRSAWLNEAAFRQEVVISLALVAISFMFPVSKVEHLLLVASLALVVIVELLNSAIEAVVDRIGSEWHELSGRAKDIGSSAVFVSLCLAVFIWLYILV